MILQHIDPVAISALLGCAVMVASLCAFLIMAVAVPNGHDNVITTLACIGGGGLLITLIALGIGAVKVASL